MKTQVRSMLFITALITGLALQGACSKKEPAPKTTPQAAQVADRETEAVALQEKPVQQVAVTPILTPQPKVVEAPPPKESEPEPTVVVDRPGLTVKAVPMDPVTAIEYMVSRGWNEIRSISAKINGTYDQLGGDGERHHTSDGVSDFVRDGAQVRTVSRVGTYMKIHTGGEPPLLIVGQKRFRHSDGKFMYTLTERKTGAVATKRFSNHMQIKYLGGARMFSFIRALKNVRELPNEDIGGSVAFVLEGELPRYHRKYRHYIDSETGILLKMVVENSANQSTSVTEFTKIEINIEFPDGHFDFNPPAGLEVQDLTIPGAELKPPSPHKPLAEVEVTP
jgi:outer membrane lipoprotein-sorting protein